MGKSDLETSAGHAGRTENESPSPHGEAQSSDAPISEDEKWGFRDKKGGWPSETKAGVAIMVLLLGAFGFIAWNKYGNGAKTLASINTQGGDQNAQIPEGPDGQAPGADVSHQATHTEFQQPTEPGRIVANESDFLNSQAEPIGGDDGGNAWDTAPAGGVVDVTRTPAASADLTPDTFAGFSEPAPAPPTESAPAPPTQSVAASEPAGSATFDAGFDAQPSAFDSEPAAAVQQPVAAADPKASDDFGWDTEPGFAASTESDAADPFETAPTASSGVAQPNVAQSNVAQPSAIQSNPTKPTDDFGGFDDQPITKSQPGAGGFDDDLFADDRAPASASAPAKARVDFAPQPAPTATQVVSQPNPVQRSDQFRNPPADSRAQIDFNETPVTNPGNAFDPEPQRYNRGTSRPAQQVVTKQPEYRSDVRRANSNVRARQDELYEVRTSETYWSISKTVYGSARYYKALARYNQTRVPDPRKMRPGTKLLIPDKKVLEQKYPTMFPTVRTAAQTTSYDINTRQPAGLYVNSRKQLVYRVGSADTLNRIAEKLLGRSARWTEIYNMNRSQLSNPRAIRPGMLLLMPADAVEVSYQ